MQSKRRFLLACLIICMFISLSLSNAQSNIEIVPLGEPLLFDNDDGNWTAKWELLNPSNYSTTNVDILHGKAMLKQNRVSIIDDTVSDFKNGTWENLVYI